MNASHVTPRTSLPSDTTTEAARSQITGLMKAIVAACALMAHADGEVAGAERRRVLAILRENPAMSVFSPDEIAEEMAAHEANFRFDPELAQQLARETLQPLAGNQRAGNRIVAACRALIPADGIAHPAEYRMLVAIKSLIAFDDAVTRSDPGRSAGVAAAQI